MRRLERVRDAFVESAKRADRAGFDLSSCTPRMAILLHQFLSPITNTRTDQYGGSLENRMRYPLEVFKAVRAAFPAEKPIIVRFSAIDWIEGGWDMAGSLAFSQALKDAGCDDRCHLGRSGPAPEDHHRAGLSGRLCAHDPPRRDMPVMAVGQITEPKQAETIIATGQADLVALARGMLWDPRWAWKAAVALGAEIALPAPYARCNPALRQHPSSHGANDERS
jgi:2,4-dienoyl-CoA reductase-like NADH-dependent reductase (Old Yellow Enzyme family)